MFSIKLTYVFTEQPIGSSDLDLKFNSTLPGPAIPSTAFENPLNRLEFISMFWVSTIRSYPEKAIQVRQIKQPR